MKVKPKSEVWVNGVCYIAGQELPASYTSPEMTPKKKKEKKTEDIQKEGE